MTTAITSADPPVCRVLAAEHSSSLALFFDRLREAGVEKFFHPHSLTTQEAVALANYSGRDFYCVMLQSAAVIGYGMLRGWDEGYDVPRLGIAIDPSVRGRGYGRLLMNFLHASARARGATRVRLTVEPQNHGAIELYRSLGYTFQEHQDRQLLGSLALASARSLSEDLSQ